MTTISLSDNINNLIHRHRWEDNGQVPDPRLYNLLGAGIDKVGHYLGKCLWRGGGNLDSIQAAGGTRNRWRTAFRTGKFTRGIYVYMVAALSGAGSPSVKYHLDLVDTLTFLYGNTASTPTDVPGELGHFIGFVNCSPSSDYTGYFEDVDAGRLALAVIYEAKESLDTDNGYLPLNHVVNEPIYDTLCEGMMALGTALWKDNGAAVASWSSSTAGTRTRTSTTDINLLDGTSTTVTTSTPGWTIDSRYRNTASKTTVPYVFKAYSKVAAGAGGHIYLKNSAGTVLATLTTTSTTGAWISTTVNLPNTEAKLDVHYDGDGTNLHTVDAVTLYEKG